MACTAQYPALLEARCASTSSSARCCCTTSAWRAPRTLTGSLATSDHNENRGPFILKSGIWERRFRSAPRRKWKCQAEDESYETGTYTLSTLWDGLSSSISYLSEADLNQVKHALKVAYDAHNGQKRRSGEPFIIHPVEVARILGELEMDWETIAAGLLHDTVEDTNLVTFEELEERFGFNVRRIVEGETKVSKLGKIQCSDSDRDVKADDLRQMFLAMTEEVRVIVVKLADRLHNMRTLSFMPRHKQKQIALETLQIFAPLARLLGIHKIKSELEELSFMYAYPAEYFDLKKRVDLVFNNQRDMILQARKLLKEAMQKDQFLSHAIDSFKILILRKELYSVYKKIKQSNSFREDIGDIVQVRLVLQPKLHTSDQFFNTKQACYYVLGLVHALWPPVPQTMKDYIATPKPNGYKSLHTKVIPFSSETFFPLEVQIRTDKMDKIAEYGIAAYYSGKLAFKSLGAVNGSSGGLNAGDLARRVSWLNSIRQWQEEFVGNMTSREFVDTVTGDLLGSRVFVFSPKGEIKNLPKGATVIDYAYHIHTDVGNKMVAAKVNGNLVSPTHVLSNAEVVEILTYEQGLPSKQQFLRHKRWLQFAMTKSARHKLIKFLKEQAMLSAIELTADAVKKFITNSEPVDFRKDQEDSPSKASSTRFRGHLKNLTADLSSLNSYTPKLLPAQDSMVYGGRMINGKHSKRGRGKCVVGSAAFDTERSLTNLNGIPFQDEVRSSLQDWLTSRVISWQQLGGSVQWFSISCSDRRNILAEVIGMLGSAGIFICACVAEADPRSGLGTMLFQIDGSIENLEEACTSMQLIDGVLSWSLGCSWQPPDTRQHIDAHYQA